MLSFINNIPNLDILSVGEWLGQFWYICSIDYDLAIKIN